MTATEEPSTMTDDPTTVSRKAPRGRGRTWLGQYALVGVWAAMALLYCVLMPTTFMSVSTLQSILSSQSALTLLALAALCTFVAGEFDLSFASVMGLSATITPVLVTRFDTPIVVACLASLAVAVACGVVNAVFVVALEVPSLVVTLGSASLFSGLAQLIASSTTTSISHDGFSQLALHRVLGLPLSFYYGLAACGIFAYVMSHTPLGRHVVFVGANREVARLTGINVARIRAGSYIVGSLVAGFAGLVLVASVGGFDPAGSAIYLLPALAAVFLGTAVVAPGRFNPLGTFIGIYFLATGIIGLQLLGYSGWVQDVFYGSGLVLAVSAAAIIGRRVSSS